MARYTGANLALEWVHSAGTTWLEGDFRSFTTTESQESADSTAGNDTYKAYIPTVADASGEAEILDTSGTAGTAQWAALAPNSVGTLNWYPIGTTAGNVKYTASSCFINNREREFPYDDVVVMTIGFQFVAAPTAGTAG